MKKVFIAYAEDDVKTAEELHQFLKDAGHNPWLDKDILPGEKISYEECRAIEESDFFLALLSQQTQSERGTIQRQLSYAYKESELNPKNEIFIIPVRLDDCKVEREFLRDLRPLDLFKAPERELEKLLRVLRLQSEPDVKQDTTSRLSQMLPKFKPKPQKPPSKFPKQIIIGVCIAILLLAAVWYILSAFHFHDNQVDDHLEIATSFLNQGMYTEALEQYGKALQICENCPQSLPGKSKAEIFRKIAETKYNPSEMIERLKHISGIPEDDPHVLMLLGNMYAQAGEQKKAESYYLQATEKEPALAEAWFSLGILYHEQGNKEDALEMFQKAVRIAELNSKYLNNLAWTYFETGKYDKAIQSYEKLLKADADFLLAYLEIAKTLLMNKDPDTALQYYRILTEKITNNKIADKPANTGPWYFPVDGESVVLDNLEAKKYYAWFSLAAASFLFGSASEMQTHIKKTDALSIESVEAHNIRFLVDWDISEILKKYDKKSGIREQAEAFRRFFIAP